MFAFSFPISETRSSLRAKPYFMSLCLPSLAYQIEDNLKKLCLLGRKWNEKPKKKAGVGINDISIKKLKEASRTQIIIFGKTPAVKAAKNSCGRRRLSITPRTTMIQDCLRRTGVCLVWLLISSLRYIIMWAHAYVFSQWIKKLK